MIRRARTALILLFTLTWPMSAWSAENETTSEEAIFDDQYCSRYNTYRDFCMQDQRCRWDDYNRVCRGAQQDPRPCNDFNNNPQVCDNQPHCRYDDYNRICVPRNNPRPDPRPNPRPNQCERINDPRMCEQTRGCHFDQRLRQCVESGRRDPNPRRPTIMRLQCFSTIFTTNSCPVNGQIIQVNIINQQGPRGCNNNWGFQNNVVWVRGGCKGTFDVTYYPN